ncbi:alpha/beta hydrolase [Oscillatoria sp. CS-180]|uniref:alpha/beta fold hydrolase n=1 Tax=Oscillatoria sp. CS-180 TaxID=3021720 RepID=UPI00232DA5C1|nr:alpha/beta hydrolase [Oscillatoria sp. CS-180]MDB9525624.1 alpha/beta hydrolase [Oscillatoria sp. CS-180]
MQHSSSPSLFSPSFPQLEKPLLVMLPGMDGTGKLFMSQIQSLSRYFDVRCLSIPENNRQDWKDLAQSVVELIYHAQRKRLTYLCGESFGGCLALQVALTAPQILSRLVVINPASALRRQAWLRWTTQYSELVPEWLFKTSGAIALPLLANFDRIDETQRHLFVKTVRPISQSCVTWRIKMLNRFEANPDHLKRLSTPTALLASGRDRLFPSDKEARLLSQYLPNAVIRALPHSGHVCLLEKDIDLADCLASLNFLPKQSNRKQSQQLSPLETSNS